MVANSVADLHRAIYDLQITIVIELIYGKHICSHFYSFKDIHIIARPVITADVYRKALRWTFRDKNIILDLLYGNNYTVRVISCNI